MVRVPQRERSKQEVKDLRLVAFVAPLMAAFFVFAMRPVMNSNHSGVREEMRSVVFGNIHSWPGWVRNGWWPLDLVVVWFSMWLVLWLMHCMMFNNSRPDPAVWRMILGAQAAFGCFGSVLSTMIGGWYHGIEGFFVIAGGVTVFGTALGVCVGLLLGIGWLGQQAYHKMQAREPSAPGSWDERWAMLGELNRRFWRHLGMKRWTQPFMKLRHWLTAADLPDPVYDEEDEDRDDYVGYYDGDDDEEGI